MTVGGRLSILLQRRRHRLRQRHGPTEHLRRRPQRRRKVLGRHGIAEGRDAWVKLERKAAVRAGGGSGSRPTDWRRIAAH